MADVRKVVQDAAYVTVGIGVLAFQKAQVRRRETRAKVEAEVKDVRERLTKTGKDVQGTLTGLREQATARAGEARGRIPAIPALPALPSVHVPDAAEIKARIAPVAGEIRSRVEPLTGQVRLPERLAKAVEVGRSRLSRTA